MPVIPGTQSLAPQEQDVHALLRWFLHKVDLGNPLSYATFREAWQDLHFSLIYEGCLEHSTLPGFMQSLFAVACDHLQAPLAPAEPAAGPDGADPATQAGDEVQKPPNQQQEPPSAGGTPTAHLQARSTERVGAHPAHAAAKLRRAQRPRRPASGSDLLAAAVARCAGTGAKAPGAASQPEHAVERRQQPAAMPRIDSAALRAMLLEEGDAEQPGPSSAAVVQNGEIAEGMGGDLDQDDMQHVVSTLQDLNVPDVEPDHAPVMPGTDHVGEPGHGSVVQQAVDSEAAESSPSLALQVGALYAIYTLHETQPGSQKVRPYLPLSSLRVVLEVVREMRRRGIPDAAAVLRRLVEGNALVCGAVLRPPACAPAQPVQQPRMAQVDMRERNAVLPLTLTHLQATAGDLRELKHLQLLCDSYRSAQARVFAAADPADLPPSIADLNMGKRLSSMLDDLTFSVQETLETGTGTRMPGGKRSRKDVGSTWQEGTTRATHEGADEDLLPEGADMDITELEGGEGLNLSGLPAAARRVEQKKARERAVMRRKQALWAARGAAALAAASDMPGSPRAAAASPPQRERRAMDAALRDRTAAEPAGLAGPLEPAEQSAAGDGVATADGPAERQEAGVQRPLEAAPATEQPARAGRKRQASGAAEAPEDLADEAGGQPRKRRQKEPWRARNGETQMAVAAAPSTEQLGVGSEAPGLRPKPGRIRIAGAVEQKLQTAAAVAENGRSVHPPEELEGGEVAAAQDGMEGLEFDILGMPVIPDFGSVLQSADDGPRLLDAAPNGFETDMVNDEDHSEAANAFITAEQRASVLSSNAAQPTRAVSTNVGAHFKIPQTPGAISKHGPARGEQMNGDRSQPGRVQGKGRKGSGGVQARGSAHKTGGAPLPSHDQLDSNGPIAARPLLVAERGPPMAPLVPGPPSSVGPSRKNAALMAKSRKPAGSAAAAPAPQQEQPAAAPGQEMALPTKKDAKAGKLRGAPDLAAADMAGQNGVPTEGQHAAVASKSGMGSRESKGQQVVDRVAVRQQPNGAVRDASLDQEGPEQKGAPMDWAAYATDMARLAAEAEALLAEEDEDL